MHSASAVLMAQAPGTASATRSQRIQVRAKPRGSEVTRLDGCRPIEFRTESVLGACMASSLRSLAPAVGARPSKARVAIHLVAGHESRCTTSPMRTSCHRHGARTKPTLAQHHSGPSTADARPSGRRLRASEPRRPDSACPAHNCARAALGRSEMCSRIVGAAPGVLDHSASATAA